MKLLVVAVGHKMPGWVDDAFAEYAKRLPRNFAFELTEVRPEPRTSGKTVPQLLAAEAARIEAAIPAGALRVACDEHGKDLTTMQLSEKLRQWQDSASDIALVIGGPDGLAPSVKDSARLSMRLSSMTLPHGLARVLLAEQIYRAWSILQNHPYHRE
ncbi:MAG: 23S rRNA (pseudouridine(1915)-N(3))-methyltransferase RlmH [Betaproteobacteria bacterium]